MTELKILQRAKLVIGHELMIDGGFSGARTHARGPLDNHAARLRVPREVVG